MSWRVKDDQDAFKEVWLLFENDGAKFPLYPGESALIEYTYDVPGHKWGRGGSGLFDCPPGGSAWPSNSRTNSIPSSGVWKRRCTPATAWSGSCERPTR